MDFPSGGFLYRGRFVRPQRWFQDILPQAPPGPKGIWFSSPVAHGTLWWPETLREPKNPINKNTINCAFSCLWALPIRAYAAAAEVVVPLHLGPEPMDPGQKPVVSDAVDRNALHEGNFLQAPPPHDSGGLVRQPKPLTHIIAMQTLFLERGAIS